MGQNELTYLLEIGYIESHLTEAFTLNISSQFINKTLSLCHICGVESSKFARNVSLMIMLSLIKLIGSLYVLTVANHRSPGSIVDGKKGCE